MTSSGDSGYASSAGPYGQAPYGQSQPPQYGQQPPQYGQAQPPQYGQGRPDSAASAPSGTPDYGRASAAPASAPVDTPGPYDLTSGYGQPTPQPSPYSQTAAQAQSSGYGPSGTYATAIPYGQPGTYGQSSPHAQSPYDQATAQVLQSGAISPYVAPSWPNSPIESTGQLAPVAGQQWHTYSDRVAEQRPAPQMWVVPGPPPTNALAIASFITSLLGMGVVPVILGHISLSQIRNNGESGRGFAIAGLVIGYFTIAVCVMFIMLIMIASRY